MDPRFTVGFEEQLKRLVQIAPYDEIMRMITSVRTEVPMRADGIVFLLTNTARMIVIPWDIAVHGEQQGSPNMGSGFFGSYASMLFEDLREIISQADAVARSQQETGISANLLLSVTGNRTVGVRTRGLNIWGP